jgi:cell division protein FtsQ
LSEYKTVRKNTHRKNREEKLRQNSRVWKIVFRSTGLTVLIVILSAGLLYIYDWTTKTDYFNAKSIDISGLSRLSEETVYRQTSLNPGINILSVNLKHVKKQLLAHPWIAEAAVKREIPSRLRVKIREHKPLAIIDLGDRYVMNRKGDIFKKFNLRDRLILPVVTGLSYSDLKISDKRISLAETPIPDILKLIQNKKDVISFVDLKRVHCDPELGLTLYVQNHIKAIKIGFGEYPKKWRYLENILEYIKNDNKTDEIELIDLCDLERVVVVPSSKSTLEPEHNPGKEA